MSAKGYEALGAVNYVEFNLREAPFDDVRVRRAVAYAIDQAYMVETLHHGVPRPGYGPLHHANPFHSDGLHTYPVDLERARALLDEAGHAPERGRCAPARRARRAPLPRRQPRYGCALHQVTVEEGGHRGRP